MGMTRRVTSKGRAYVLVVSLLFEKKKKNWKENKRLFDPFFFF